MNLAAETNSIPRGKGKFVKQALAMIMLCFALSGSQTIVSQQAVADAKQAAPPETVLATFRVKPEQLAAFLAMMPEYWKTLRDLDLVDAEPHLLLTGEENGKPIVIQVFTWKSEDVPDNAPPEVRKYWTRMNSMVEARDGKPGIDFPPMKIVDIGHAYSAPAK